MLDDLRGIIPPMVTPFANNGDIDEDGLRSEVQVLLGAGVDGLAVCGSTGEGHTLSPEETAQVCRVVIEEVGDRVPVIAGIIQDSTRSVLRYAEPLGEIGVAALQVTPVHYLFAPGEEGHFAFYREIGRVTGLPIIIYNVVPWNTLSPHTLMRLTEVPEVVGVKQSGGDMHALAQLIELNDRDIKIFSAIDDLLYPSFVLGADGAIAAICTVLPDLCVPLLHAFRDDNHVTARDIHRRILPVWRVLNRPDMISRVKAAIELRGRRVGSARHPFLPVSSTVRAEIDTALRAALTM